MAGDGIVYLLWGDLTGLARCRGLPLVELEARAEAGLGWACAGHALTPFEAIVPNVWGPMDEARQIPDLATRFCVPEDGPFPAIEGVICDSRAGIDRDWDCCARTFLRNALSELRAETGLELIATFEHEFLLSGDFKARTPFSFAAVREVHPVLLAIEQALRAAGAPVETIEPEYGLGQYEISSPPLWALAAADKALITREIVREMARRHGLEASFTPKPAPDAVGSGCHTHFSFRDADGANVAHDPEGPLGLSEIAARFCAGILAHVDALVAVTAPTPVSYYRLGPHHWSCGFRAIGIQNREAALRVCPGIASDPERRRRSFNIEYRPIDAASSPYLALGMLVRAGLDGIRRELRLPEAVSRDPSELTSEEARAAGVTPLPTSLGAAIDALEADKVARSWMSPTLLDTFVAIKRWEARYAEMVTAEELFRRYRETY